LKIWEITLFGPYGFNKEQNDDHILKIRVGKDILQTKNVYPHFKFNILSKANTKHKKYY
jgi:hypothetical protein